MSNYKLVQLLSIIAISLAISVRLPWDTSATQTDQLSLEQQIDEYFNRLVKDGFSGAVLIAKDGDVVLEKGYGSANDADGERITTDTVFDIGSISKQFTAAAILYLEQGRLLSIEDPISKYFEDVPQDKVNITIHQLLTHSAGFEKEHFAGDLIPMKRDEAQRAIFALPLDYKPGERYYYSNTGYTLLAILIERISGQSYPSYLKQNFFDPLHMNHTGFYNDSIWDLLPVANTYFNAKDMGKPSDWPGPYWGVMGNGGVMSTVGDLYIWWQSLQNHKILSSEQTKKLFTRHISEGSGDSSYGYGWTIQDSPYGNLITHNGGGIGGNSDLAVYTDKNLIIVICSNRIVWRTFLDLVPFEIRLPATEAREKLAANILSGDFLKLPKPTFLLAPILSIVTVIAIVALSLVIFLFKRKRTQANKTD